MTTERDAYQRAVQPLLDELAAAGFRVHQLPELRRFGARYEPVVSVLVRALEQVKDPKSKEELARVLAVPWAKPALEPLMRAFATTSNGDASAKAALAAAIEVLADESAGERLIELARTRSHGGAREGIVLALGKLDGPRVLDELIELLGDRGVGGHALTALSRSVARQRVYVDAALVKPFLRDGRAWVRREAKDLMHVLQELE